MYQPAPVASLRAICSNASRGLAIQCVWFADDPYGGMMDVWHTIYWKNVLWLILLKERRDVDLLSHYSGYGKKRRPEEHGPPPAALPNVNTRQHTPTLGVALSQIEWLNEKLR